MTALMSDEELIASMRDARAGLVRQGVTALGVDGSLYLAAAARLESLLATLADRKQEIAAVRELMNVYNLGGWTDAIAPMRRALAAESALTAANAEIASIRRARDTWMARFGEVAVERDAANEALRGARGETKRELATRDALQEKYNALWEQWADALTRKERSEGSLKVQLERAEAAAESARVECERLRTVKDAAVTQAEANRRDAERYRAWRSEFDVPDAVDIECDRLIRHYAARASAKEE